MIAASVTMYKETARLTILLACAALATSRLGLLLHEFVGHGGTAIALGGHITKVKLFWFAGGWVRPDLDAGFAGQLAVMLGGIAIETIVGTALWIALRKRDGLGTRIVRAIGAALVVHAMWYLATGTWYGFGDGWMLYIELGDGRLAVALGAGVVGSLAAFYGARAAFSPIALATPGRGWIAALVIALGINAALYAGDVYLSHDTAYTALKRPERDREIARELAAFKQQHDAAPEAIAEKRVQLEHEHPSPFPLAPILVVLTLAATVAGCFASLRGGRTPEVVSRALTTRAAVIAGLSVALVIAIDLFTS